MSEGGGAFRGESECLPFQCKIASLFMHLRFTANLLPVCSAKVAQHEMTGSGTQLLRCQSELGQGRMHSLS